MTLRTTSTIMRIMELTKREKINLLNKLVPIVSKKLLKLKAEKYDFSEMRDLTGIANNRLSELAHYERYDKHVMNEKTLIQLMGGGLVKVDELLKKNNLSVGETAYIETLVVFESKVNAEDVKLIVKHGFTVNDAIKELIKVKKLK